MHLRRSLYEGYKTAHNKLFSVKNTSDFQATGRLTPKEFVEAGDELIQKNPVWQWVGGPDHVQDYLPDDKKCLVYRGAPCAERAPVAQTDAPVETVDEDGFVVTEAPKAALPTTAVEEEKVLNWDDEDSASDDEDVVTTTPDSSSNLRVYDVYIVYDKYYETPRMYLVGYASDHVTPLTTDQMKQDVYCSNYGKTVTIDPHPVLSIPCISIHPCRHAETMCSLMCRMQQYYENEKGEEARRNPFIFPAHLALLLFLKFISTVLPTIQYDISSGFDLI
ncbi:putative Autophagocytosis protein [Leptomonas pyrrhocoris]|uniref:Putative Autophagocytosis protein n=1 Tax=Leptomonas pyrrhocoris TaxID=157538 RepID=A0A0N0VDX5_LEPPY|nr:putative Autophagocytosis protein [Leptomonas pyrrhocoris]XP_015655247.1 putative Autophagocytosis protein [Leptomonas pyrrhocoris]KPA76807.1 putative Autophagocytosis protein [Leptomonas pyrrhocoris]KPA76808.1 putative Autophagocytosis protein [Leptomonas pyrrhocoris]|eukprot:XP_015655246.1 putative Autophagocytosis protein [Leptomonas pyrrhocoris]